MLGWRETETRHTISGIGIFHPRVSRDAPAVKFSVKALGLKALGQNRLFCLPHYGRWFQTESVEDIKNRVFEILPLSQS
jgi:hypothetical protein